LAHDQPVIFQPAGPFFQGEGERRVLFLHRLALLLEAVLRRDHHVRVDATHVEVLRLAERHHAVVMAFFFASVS
jgi:hypothetical protein